MTRRKPWTGDEPTTQSSTTQTEPQNDIQLPQQLSSAVSDLTEPQPPEQARTLDTGRDSEGDVAVEQRSNKQTYEPPQVAEDIEEALHLNHPDPEIKAQVEAAEQRANVASATTVPQYQAVHNSNSDTESEDDGGDLLETLGDFLTGGATGRHTRPSNPFGFLDFIGETLAAPFSEIQHQQESHDNTSQARAAPVNDVKPRGNFHKSSSEVKLEDGHLLVAKCRDIAGGWQSSRIDLDQCLMNDDGHFKWSIDGGFSHTARRIRLHNGEMLHAHLQACNGRWRPARVNLSHMITNGNGQLALIPGQQ